MSEYKLKTPCANCPFRSDIKSYLRVSRVADIEGSLRHRQASFTCHKTTEAVEDDDGGSEMVDGPKAQHCAGALILLETIDEPNQMMRIAQRLGSYDPDQLDYDAPVFKSFDDMKRAQGDYEEPESAEDPCSVSGHGCEAPAGWMGDNGVESGTEDAEHHCYECGEPVCGPCSRVVKGQRRCEYCADEAEDEDDEETFDPPVRSHTTPASY